MSEFNVKNMLKLLILIFQICFNYLQRLSLKNTITLSVNLK